MAFDVAGGQRRHAMRRGQRATPGWRHTTTRRTGRRPQALQSNLHAATTTTATTLCDYIGDISGFTRRVTGGARIARFRSIGLHALARSVAGSMMTSFLSVLLRVAGCLARCTLCKHGRRGSNHRSGGKRDYCEFHSLFLWIPPQLQLGGWRRGPRPNHGPARETWPDDRNPASVPIFPTLGREMRGDLLPKWKDKPIASEALAQDRNLSAVSRRSRPRARREHARALCSANIAWQAAPGYFSRRTNCRPAFVASSFASNVPSRSGFAALKRCSTTARYSSLVRVPS